MRPVFLNPFNQDGRTYATDTHILISLPLNPNNYKEELKPNIKGVMLKNSISREITLKEIESLLKEIPLVNEIIEKEINTKCIECNGYGEVTWEYQGFEKDCECPICDGTGIVQDYENIKTDNKIKDPKYKIKILDEIFKNEYISLIAETIRFYGKDKITLTAQNNTHASQFKIGDNINILLMGLNEEKEEDEILKLI